MRRAPLAVFLAVYASFLVYSARQAPVPAVNEPHYLTKARHFWNPDWCRGDFFLESSNPHWVFYFTIGQFTRFLTFEQAAWCGRVIALALLAVGWTALVWRLLPQKWGPLWSAWLFLALASIGNYSGEWLVGGVEGKVFSYALIFCGLACLWDGRWKLAGACLGAAVSFHVLVGGWALLCMTAAAVICRGVPQSVSPTVEGRRVARVAAAAGLLFVCALPGLLPAWATIQSGDAQTKFQADYIQVTYRLAHHLDPMAFSLTAAGGYIALTLLWLTARWVQSATRLEPYFAAFVLSSVWVALAGLLVGAGPRPIEEMQGYQWRMWMLKFYPFRLSDVLIPMAAAISAVGLQHRMCCGFGVASEFQQRVYGRLNGVVFAGVFVFSLWWAGPGLLHAGRLPPKLAADWKATCNWFRAETHPESLVLCPRGSPAFKWYAQRPEYVSFKDCPQDAVGIVEWNRRLRRVSLWIRNNYDEGLSAAALSQLHELTGVDYLVVRRLAPIAAEPVFANDTYRVYDLRPAVLTRTAPHWR